LAKLLVPELEWIWNAIANAADRRGDPEMVSGPAVTLKAPANASHRAAAAGLLAGVPRPGATVRVRLESLTDQIRVRGGDLTPGTVAAHAAGRALATKAAEDRQRRAAIDGVTVNFAAACNKHPELGVMATDVTEHLRRTGWIARLSNQDDPDVLIADAIDVAVSVMRLPEGERTDRRMLLPHSPHALDEGSVLAGLVLAILVAAGRISSDRRLNPRGLWAQAGVDCDQIVGGLSVIGVFPEGWTLPLGAVCTLPPRELLTVSWSKPPHPGAWVFVTENPSILAAAAEIVASNPITANNIRLICTAGNPSALEITALSRMAELGWRIAARADFDPAGIRTVTTILNRIPTAIAWKMGCGDYLASAPTLRIGSEPMPSTPWDPCLAALITKTGCVAFEEAISDLLVEDLRRGLPT
jgi:uncharacterized protein (TIGR02679 family)